MKSKINPKNQKIVKNGQKIKKSPKTSKNLKNSLSFKKNIFYFLNKTNFGKKKSAILLGFQYWRTQFDQSSPVQPISEMKKSQKISKHNFFSKFFFFLKKPYAEKEKKKCIRSMRFDQSSPVHPISESREG